MNTQTQQKTNKKEAAIASLLKTFSRKDIQPDTVYAVLKHVSASGMQREISFYIAGKNGIENINYDISQILGIPFGKTHGLKIKGCGMDMGFATIYDLSAEVFGNPKKLNNNWI